MLEERFNLVQERVIEIAEETVLPVAVADYFKKVANFMIMGFEYLLEYEQQVPKSMEQLEKENTCLYQDILPQNYKTSYGNPSFARQCLGEEFGPILSALYKEIRAMIPMIYEKNKENITMLGELFVEIYGLFSYSYMEEKKAPSACDVKNCFYWYVLDYSEFFEANKIYTLVNPEYDFFTKKIKQNQFLDLNYLYETGEYVTQVEKQTATYINQLPEDKIELMASTFTEGYRLGFLATGKDISKKKTVSIVYEMGFERVVKKAMQLFEDMGLIVLIRRRNTSVCNATTGFSGHIANKQYEFDHKNDQALFLDKLYVQRKLEALKYGFDLEKENADLYGGPAVMETFGEIPFAPKANKDSLEYTKEQQKLLVELKGELFKIQNNYIKEEERSFTIIAFPIPEIGEQFEEIFDEIIKVNTLDYKEYQMMQQTLIDALDEGTHVKIIGGNGNKTNLLVSLKEITNKEKESKFENCVADVNIPVGEVFTSPRLQETTGKLHVSRVFLHELEYKQLEIDFEDGFTTSYHCENFEVEEENKKYIKENLLYHHESLPMGEFAIGTNTVAYMVAKKYDIHKVLPILIAEKMGPHFAIGDTCYSHVEHLPMYNPDGKEIIARGNEITTCQKEEDKKYFNCHTDITIPYEELGSLSVIKADGSEKMIIENGRFVLVGLEPLNKPFDV